MPISVIPNLIRVSTEGVKPVQTVIIPGADGGGEDVSIATGEGPRQLSATRDGSLTLASDAMDGIKNTGSSVQSWSHGLTTSMLTTNVGLGGLSGNSCFYVVMIPILEDITLTGAAFFQVIQGVYTAAAYNGLALYAFNDATTNYDMIAQTTDDGNIWKQAVGTFLKKPFAATVDVTAGNYWLGANYNTSAKTTAPRIAAAPSVVHSGISNLDSGTNVKTYQGDDDVAQVIPPSSFGAYTSDIRRPWLAVY